MQTRRKTFKQSAMVAGLLASTGLFPQYALAYNKGAFEGKSLAEVLKALGAGAPAESKDVTIGGPVQRHRQRGSQLCHALQDGAVV